MGAHLVSRQLPLQSLPFAYRDPLNDSDIYSYPHFIADFYRCRNHVGAPFRIHRVIECRYYAVMSYENIITDCNASLVIRMAS